MWRDRGAGLLVGLVLGVAASVWAGIPATPPTALTPPANDQANAVYAGQITGTGPTAPVMMYGSFNVVFGGTGGPNGSWSGTVRLERSFDGGATWFVAGVGGQGAQAIYNTPNQDVSLVVGEFEKGVLYRLNATAWSSGTVIYRFSTSGVGALSMGVQ